MLRYLRDTGDTRPVKLVYANDEVKDIIFREELDALPENFDVTYALMNPPGDWQGETGHVDGDMLKRVAARPVARGHVFLCGPPPMMDSLTKALCSLEVPNRRIHFERFDLGR